MSATSDSADSAAQFRDAVQGLERGDFSRLEPLFTSASPDDPRRCAILAWHAAGLFAGEPEALNEALTCACFLGKRAVAEALIVAGVDPAAGDGTGMTAFHWAANRGQLATVRLLIEHKAPLETRNMYGGTVLGCTVWSAIHEPRGEQLRAIELLIEAGAALKEAGYPTGNERVDEVLRRHGVKT
ncbi:MAG: ankyrin repeat domain-containing protein [Planctomycetota bacterium]|nr:ankyrin repeat domain-containing protein [Planctomycetota bacterium]